MDLNREQGRRRCFDASGRTGIYDEVREDLIVSVSAATTKVAFGLFLLSFVPLGHHCLHRRLDRIEFMGINIP
jgi:hypothetical protein